MVLREQKIIPKEEKDSAITNDNFIQETIENILIKAENLSVHFPSKKSFFGKPLLFTKAVDNVNFEIYKGETLGLVGESGCGKTTLGCTLLRLIEPTSGKIYFEGKDLSLYANSELRKFRKHIQIIFQDPYSSLNPSLTIGSAIEEPLTVHESHLTKKQKKDRVISLLEKVGLHADHYYRYPHEFSKCQRQRIDYCPRISIKSGIYCLRRIRFQL